MSEERPITVGDEIVVRMRVMDAEPDADGFIVAEYGEDASVLLRPGEYQRAARQAPDADHCGCCGAAPTEDGAPVPARQATREREALTASDRKWLEWTVQRGRVYEQGHPNRAEAETAARILAVLSSTNEA